MGIGHLAVGLASKRWAPRASLGWLTLAPIFADLLWSLFILTGIEQSRIVPGITKAIPLDLQYIGVSHSLVAVLAWGALFAGVYFAFERDARAAVVLFIGVFSHFVLDWISHRPDMPILPSGPRVGLGLWNHPIPAMLTEVALVAGGLAIYMRSTRARSPSSTYQLIALIVVLVGINVGAYFGPPPPSVEPMAALNLLLIAVVFIFHRIDRQRDGA